MAGKQDVEYNHRPFERYGHSLAQMGGKLFLWAGGMRQMPGVHASAAKEEIMSKTEMFNLKTGKWECVRTKGSSHSGISYYTNAIVGEDVYFFGGQCGHGSCFYNNITKLNTTEMRWNDVRTSFIKAPMRKYSCGMVSFQCDGGTFLLVMGGYGEPIDEADKLPNALYVESTNNPKIFRSNEHHIISIAKPSDWIIPIVQGDVPPPCSGFTLTSLGENQAVLFGGYHSGRGKVNTVYIAELKKEVVNWKKYEAPVGSGPDEWPVGRCDHSAVVLSGHGARQPYPILIIAGGVDNDAILLKDLWMFNTSSITWTKVNAPENDVGRALSSMSIMNIGAQVVWLILFGGATKWEKGRSTKEQGLTSDTTVMELGYNQERGDWNFICVVNAADYQRTLKDRLTERRKSLRLDD